MRLLVCGVRGSTPAPGPELARCGGHTSSVAVAADGARVLLHHHDPDRTDDEIDAILASPQKAGIGVLAAAEGSEIDL